MDIQQILKLRTLFARLSRAYMNSRSLVETSTSQAIILFSWSHSFFFTFLTSFLGMSFILSSSIFFSKPKICASRYQLFFDTVSIAVTLFLNTSQNSFSVFLSFSAWSRVMRFSLKSSFLFWIYCYTVNGFFPPKVWLWQISGSVSNYVCYGFSEI